MQTHPDTAEQTYAKQREINEEWTQLTAKANSRKEKLLDSYDLQRFLSDYRDLMSWINSMMGLVSSDELASDVTGAEALLERHQVNFYRRTILRKIALFILQCVKIISFEYVPRILAGDSYLYVMYLYSLIINYIIKLYVKRITFKLLFCIFFVHLHYSSI